MTMPTVDVGTPTGAAATEGALPSGPGAAAGASARGAKRTSGAAGRCLVVEGAVDGELPWGASAVAARGEVCGRSEGCWRPTGGVGGATRGASRCPHSWQNVRWLALFAPHVVQI